MTGRPVVQLDAVLLAAETRARLSWQRQVQATKHCIGGVKRKNQLRASAANLRQTVDDLRAAKALVRVMVKTLRDARDVMDSAQLATARFDANKASEQLLAGRASIEGVLQRIGDER